MSYNQPLASTTDYGVIKVGTGLTATNGIISTATGLALNYGFVNSSTTQTNPVANAINTLTFDTLGPANGVTIGGNGTQIVVANPGIYTKLFTLTVNKAGGGSSLISIWLAYNGVDLVGSSQDLVIAANASEIFVSGNYTLSMAASSNIQMRWSSPDITMSLTAIPIRAAPARPTGYSTKVTLTRIS